MSKVTRWRRGLWSAGQWWSYAWAWIVRGGAGRGHVQGAQAVVLILLLLLALTSAIIRPPLNFPSQLSKSQPQKYHRIGRRGLTSLRYRPSVSSHTTHCFFNHLCSCEVLLWARKNGLGESTSVDDFGNVDYYDGIPVRDLVNGDLPLHTSTFSPGDISTDVYQGQFGSISSPSSLASTSSTESSIKLNATVQPVLSALLSSEYLPHPSHLKSAARSSSRRGGRRRSSAFGRMAKNVRDVSCVGVPFATIPGTYII